MKTLLFSLTKKGLHHLRGYSLRAHNLKKGCEDSSIEWTECSREGGEITRLNFIIAKADKFTNI